jgi:hypothetical protein
VTYDNRDFDNPSRPVIDRDPAARDSSMLSIFGMVLAAALLLGGLFYAFGPSTEQTAGVSPAPPAAAPPSTTGSGITGSGAPAAPVQPAPPAR